MAIAPEAYAFYVLVWHHNPDDPWYPDSHGNWWLHRQAACRAAARDERRTRKWNEAYECKVAGVTVLATETQEIKK